MGWQLKDGPQRIMSEINITPLTDVMLVLLVIFMVTTPLIMAESFKLKLPSAETGTAEPGLGVTISVSSGGVIEVNGKAAGREGLREALVREFATGRERVVVLRADAGTRHGLVVDILDIAKLAGAEKLSIATEPSAGGGVGR